MDILGKDYNASNFFVPQKKSYGINCSAHSSKYQYVTQETHLSRRQGRPHDKLRMITFIKILSNH